VVEIEGAKLDAMARGVPHQGVIASAAAKEYCSIEDILAIARERGEKPLIVMADGIEDPQNLGTLIRVCECAGVHGLLLPKRHSVGLTEIAARASAGAIAHLAIAKVGNLVQAAEELKKQGLWVFAAEAGGCSYDACDMTCPALIIMGSEGFGVSRLLREKSDYQVSVPMYGHVNSLNVSTAAAVIIHEAARQRHAGKK
jgi:23S rRNA (guanosine2251-2'-O)-methyltransferase